MTDIIERSDSRGVSATELSTAARRYIRAAISPNTERAYKSQVRRWQDWCEAYGLRPFPADVGDVVNFISERADAGQSLSTLKTAVAGIKFGHDILGMSFDTRAPAITRALRGIQRQTARIPKQAAPIRPTDALAMIAVEDDAGVLALRDAAVIAVGYLFALRRTELVGLDYGRHGDGDGVFRFTAHAIELTLVRTKTAASEPEKVTIPRRGNDAAIDIIKRYVAAAGIGQGDALFRRIYKSGRIGPRLSDQSVALIVKRLSGADYSGHSLRVGFAVAAAEAGADLRAIASVTRHASMEMPRRYAERADQLKTSPYNQEGVGLSRSQASMDHRVLGEEGGE